MDIFYFILEIIFFILKIIFLGSILLLILIYVYNYIKTFFSYLVIKKLDFEYLDSKIKRGYLFLWFLFYGFNFPIKVKIKYSKDSGPDYEFENFYHKIPNYLLLKQNNNNYNIFTYLEESWIHYRGTNYYEGWYEDNWPKNYIYVTIFEVDLENKKAIFKHWKKIIENKKVYKEINQKDIDEIIRLKNKQNIFPSKTLQE